MTNRTHKHKKNSQSRQAVKSRQPSKLTRFIRIIPAMLILVAAYLVHQPSKIPFDQQPSQVLSYATAMNTTDLLSSTNSQRSDNGIAVLNLNTQLTSAAQTKANDMVSRDYWSHTTPDGNDPWFFISNAGYAYKTAGENLAYGFDTGVTTVTGWMNSPPHRANLLNGAFADVGFGFANSTNYVGTGQQTVVVAMYGAPTTQPVAAPVVAQTSSPSPPPAPVQVAAVASAPSAVPSQTPSNSTTAAPSSTPLADTQISPAAQQPALNTPTEASIAPIQQQASPQSEKAISRIQLISGTTAAWSSTVLIVSLGIMALLWIMQRANTILALTRRGERFVLHNLHVDATIVSILLLGVALLQTTGVVR